MCGSCHMVVWIVTNVWAMSYGGVNNCECVGRVIWFD